MPFGVGVAIAAPTLLTLRDVRGFNLRRSGPSGGSWNAAVSQADPALPALEKVLRAEVAGHVNRRGQPAEAVRRVSRRHSQRVIRVQESGSKPRITPGGGSTWTNGNSAIRV
jgi:hypothetical protein